MKTAHSFIIACGLIVAFLVFGIFFYASRSSQQTISVVGLATESFDSDIIKWNINLTRTVGINELSSGYKLMQKDVDIVRGLLKTKGLADSSLTIQPVNSYPNYSQSGSPTTYNVQQSLDIVTDNIAAVEALALNPDGLSASGVTPGNSTLEYYYSKLSDIKAELLAAAAQDAQRRAKEIADNTGVKLGPPASMRAGVFQIKEPLSSEVSDYGMFNTRTKKKEISVTVHASFRIE